MIQISKNAINIIIVTLTEAVTLSVPVFLFEFKNDQDNTLNYFIAADVSDFTERYNKFLVTEKTLPDPLDGEVELELTGFYSYRIFEQLSSTNLDPTLCDNTTPLEVGKVLVLGVGEVPAVHDYNPTIKVYNG